VGENDIRLSARKNMTSGESVILPDSIYDHAVESLSIGAQPPAHLRIVMVAADAAAKGMNLASRRRGIDVAGIVKRGDFDLISRALMGRRKHRNRVSGAAMVRTK
jgi:hypothetical protein